MKSDRLTEIVPLEVGRLLETVHAQQAQLHSVLASLEARCRNLDASVADAVQRALLEPAGAHAARQLSQVHRAAAARFGRWSFAVVSVCALVPTLLSWSLLPSRAQVLQTRQTLEQLSAGIAQLTREGGRAELRHCGPANRLCVRIDRKSPFYGESADFMVLKGY